MRITERNQLAFHSQCSASFCIASGLIMHIMSYLTWNKTL